MRMIFSGRRGAAGLIPVVLMTALGLLAKAPDQAKQEAEGARLLKGAIDMHFHMDAPGRAGSPEQGNIAKVRLARERGMRGLLFKNHYEPTATLAYHLRLEMPQFELFGGIVLNRTNGGINPAAVEYMATQIKARTGKVVWMPTLDSEIESRTSKEPHRPFVAVSRNGELLPEVKEVISLVAKYDLVLASGHIAPEEALMVFREAHRQGVHRMIATHAMDLAGKMNMDQMLEAAKLGAIIEFDFRKILGPGGRADAIRRIGPERCFISEFWTKDEAPREYAGLDEMGAFAEEMHKRGFTDRELDVMFKENPARLLGLPVQ